MTFNMLLQPVGLMDLILILFYEQADILAKEGARVEQHGNNVTFGEKKTLIRALTMPRLQRDDYSLLSQEQQVVFLLRLYTGHKD